VAAVEHTISAETRLDITSEDDILRVGQCSRQAGPIDVPGDAGKDESEVILGDAVDLDGSQNFASFFDHVDVHEVAGNDSL